MNYLTYECYLAVGGICDSATFDRNITKATAIIDTETHKRVWDMETIPEPVKALCRDLVELYARNNTSDKVVTSHSQSAGAVSESVSYATVSQEEVKEMADNLVYDYLMSVTDDNGTPLLYRGCKA